MIQETELGIIPQKFTDSVFRRKRAATTLLSKVRMVRELVNESFNGNGTAQRSLAALEALKGAED